MGVFGAGFLLIILPKAAKRGEKFLLTRKIFSRCVLENYILWKNRAPDTICPGLKKSGKILIIFLKKVLILWKTFAIIG